jgi:hypothetical protein
VVPSAATLSGERAEDTATGRHIKQLVNLRRWAKPLGLPEERVTYHVLESEKPAAALIDFAKVNEVDQILIGAPAAAGPYACSLALPVRSSPTRHAASASCARDSTANRSRKGAE